MSMMFSRLMSPFIFFFNDTATTEIYTLSLHDALPISGSPSFGRLSTFESQSRYVQPTNKGVNHPANMILRDQLIQRHRKQRPLTPTFSLNKSHEKCPRYREGIFSLFTAQPS